MDEAARKLHNEEKITELYPVFGEQIQLVLGDLEAQGVRPYIYEAGRSLKKQLENFEAGISKVKFGFHTVTADDGKAESLAADIIDDDARSANVESGTEFKLRLAASAESRGLMTGIHWFDKGIDTTDDDIKRDEKAVNDAIANQDWKANIHTGWDATHVEPANITIEEAKNGKRPVFIAEPADEAEEQPILGLQERPPYDAQVIGPNLTVLNEQPEIDFPVRWQLKNTGRLPWGEDIKLVYVGKLPGSVLLASKRSFPLDEVTKPRPPVESDQEVEITLTMRLPATKTKLYHSLWRLRKSQGNSFGPILDVLLRISNPTHKIF